ncbi:ADP-heptose:LPS heptosyltransferase [Desulfoluna spongiiphila]|uniref:ADP-heptose:LPS heptosyltransferase n=1 Tax=Desulfoluna spongiiphila TaxID=419481 RepID=A0A1G5ADZ1_9BACT|nr:ADP-heptose:LPS heptosyltransferase [Desulfoluna spongiiphila]
MRVKTVLVIQCGALGDLICSTSVIDAVVRQFGKDTRIDFVCKPGPGGLFALDHRVNRVFNLSHCKWPVWLSPGKRNIVRSSMVSPYDVLINFGGGSQFKGLVEKVCARQKVGFYGSEDHFPQGMHMVDALKRIYARAVDEEHLWQSFPSLVGTPVDDVTNAYGLEDRYIVISPSNSHHNQKKINHRAWDDRRWSELIEALNRDIQVVVVGSRNEGRFFDGLRPFPSGVVDLVGKTSIADLVGVIEGARGLIATDTGTAHMASATGTEVFALIGPTPAWVTGPYQGPANKVHIISSNLPCSPCYKTEIMKKCRDNLCMKGISASDVYTKVAASCLAGERLQDKKSAAS